MKNKLKRITVGILAGTLALSSVSLVGCKEDKTPPDYSNSTLQFEFYAYRGPTDGKWTENGNTYDGGEDFRTVERYKEYKDAGMTINFPQGSGVYLGEAWETSKAKMVMDRGLEAGLEKTILTDQRIADLSGMTGSLIGEGKRFATEAELDETIRGYLAPYQDHPSFYGVVIADEPHWGQFEAYGQVYRSIKRVRPETFVQANLLPMTNSMSEEIYPPLTEEEKEGLSSQEQKYAMYRKYLKMFLDETGANYIMYDQYPMNETSIHNMYIPGLQIAAGLAKECGVEFYNVTQTMRMFDVNSSSYTRFVGKNDAYWLNNMLVGFGVKEIAYFTYWTNPYNSASSSFYDNGSFINLNGTKTALYDIMQKIMAEEQKLAPTILNFDYVTSNVYRKIPCVYNTSHVDAAFKGEAFAKVEKVTIDKEVALITELYDDEKELYMYMFQNVVDPLHQGANAYQAITADFSDDCTHAVLFEKGERRIVELEEGGKLTLRHRPGLATYVIPY